LSPGIRAVMLIRFKLFANQYAADFGFAVGARCLPDLAKHLAFDGQSPA